MKNIITLALLSFLSFSCETAPPTLEDAQKEIQTIIDTKSNQDIKLIEFSEIETKDTLVNSYKMHVIKFNGSIEYQKAGFTNITPFVTRNKENTFLNFVERKNPFFRNYISIDEGIIKNINGVIYYYQKDNNWAVHRLAFGLKN